MTQIRVQLIRHASIRTYSAFVEADESLLARSRFGTVTQTVEVERPVKTSWGNGVDCDVIKRMVRITGNPQPMKKYGEFSGNGDDCSFLAIFPTPFEHSSLLCLSRNRGGFGAG